MDNGSHNCAIFLYSIQFNIDKFAFLGFLLILGEGFLLGILPIFVKSFFGVYI